MATVELLLEAKQANTTLEKIDKKFEKVDQTVDKFSTAVERLEATLDKLAKSIDKVLKPIQQMNKMMGAMAGTTLKMYRDQTKGLTEQNELLWLTLKKVQNDLKNTAINLERAAKKANQADKAIEKLNKQAEKTGHRFMVFGANLGAVKKASDALSFSLKRNEYLFSVLVQSIATFVSQNVIGYLVRMTDQYKLLESRLRIVNSTFSTLNTNMSSAVSIALETRQSLFAVGNLMSRIGRNSKELARDTFKLAEATGTISKAFQVAGATAEEARNAIVQLSQALASGRLQGDELRSILELAPTLAESISKAIGITVGQLRAFAKEGLITTDIILSAVGESVEEINKNFAKIKPTVSQAITNIQTAFQAVLGGNEDIRKANDYLAASFLNLSKVILKFGKDGENIKGLTGVIKSLADNAVALGAGFLAGAIELGKFIVIGFGLRKILDLMKALEAVSLALFAGSGSIVGGIAALVGAATQIYALVSIAKESTKAFKETQEAMGLLANNLDSLDAVMKGVNDEVDRLNKKAEAMGEDPVKNAEILTMQFNAVSLAIQESNLALEQLDQKIAETTKASQREVSYMEKRWRDFARNTELVLNRVIQLVIDLGKFIFNLVDSITSGIAAAIESLAMGLGWLIDHAVPDDLEVKLGIDLEGLTRWKDHKASMMKNGKEAGAAFMEAFTGEATQIFTNFDGWMAKTSDTSISEAALDSIYGKTPEALKKRLAELEKMKSETNANLAELQAEQEKIMEKLQKDQKKTRDLMLRQFHASTEAAITQFRLDAKLAREAFNLAFKEPFNIKIGSVQGALSNFASSFQRDFQKELQTFVKEATFDFEDFFNISGEDSPFNAKGFLEALKATGKEINETLSFAKREYDDNMNVKSSGELERLFGLDGIVKKVIQSSDIIQKEIAKAGDNSILEQQLDFKVNEIVEKYGSAIVQALLATEVQMMKSISSRTVSLKDETKLLNNQKDLLLMQMAYSRLSSKSLILDMKNTDARMALELQIEKNRLLDAGYKEDSEYFKEFIEAKQNLQQLNKELVVQEEILSNIQDIAQKTRGLEDKKLELQLLKSGSSEFETQKKLREMHLDEELKIIDTLKIQDSANKDLYSQYQEFLKIKNELLNKEQEITEEIRIQKNLQKTREDIRKEELMQAAEREAESMRKGLGFLDTIMVESGLVEDPAKDFIKKFEGQLNAYLDAGVKATKLKIDEGFNITVPENFYKDLAKETSQKIADLTKESVNANLDFLALQMKEINIQQNPAGAIASGIFGKDYSKPMKFKDWQRRENGGMVMGPSHSNGGVKGFLYGNPIELEGGEYILNKKSVAKYGIPMLDALNAQKFAEGSPGGLGSANLKNVNSRQTPLSQLVGGYIPVETAIRIINGLRDKGEHQLAGQYTNKVNEILDKNIALQIEEQDMIRKRISLESSKVPVFYADGTSSGKLSKEFYDRESKKGFKPSDKAVSKYFDAETQAAVLTKTSETITTKVAPAVETLAPAVQKTASEMSFYNQYLEAAGLNLQKVAKTGGTGLTQEEIDAIESTTKMRMTNEQEAAYAIQKVKETYEEIAVDWKTMSKDFLREYFDYKEGAESGSKGMGIGGFAAGVYGKALKGNSQVAEFGTDIGSLIKDPLTGILEITAKRLAQNERFQKSLERFFDMFYSMFDGFAEGFAFVAEALVDMIEPLRPLFTMIGDFLKTVGRSLTQVIQPFSKVFQMLTPVLIYIAGFLQLLAGLIANIFGFFGGVLDQITGGIANAVGNAFGYDNLTTDKYKSLNLLRQEKEIIGEINTSIGGLADTLTDIQDVIFDIMNSSLNLAAPGVKLEMATEKYNELFTAASRLGAETEDITAFQNFTKTYLQQAQDVLKSSTQYQEIFVRVIEDLETLQEKQAESLGKDITETLKKGIFDLEMVNSDLGKNISDAVEYQRQGLLSYNDLIEYIGYKLAQIDEDIDLKDFAEFGAIGSLGEVEEAFYSYRDKYIKKWERSMGDAISSSTLEQDLIDLFGFDINTKTFVNDALETAISVSEMYVAQQEGRANALKRVQPTIGDVTLNADFQREENVEQDFVITLPDLGIDFDLFGQLGDGIKLLWNNILFGIETIWGELEGGLNQLITNLETGFQTIKDNWDGFLNALGIPDLASWENWVAMFEGWAEQLDLPGGWSEFKENWDQWVSGLNLPDLGSWDTFKEWFDTLGLPDLSGIDLGDSFTGFKTEWDNLWSWTSDMSISGGWTNFKTQWDNLWSGLSLTGIDMSWWTGIIDKVTSIFNVDAKSILQNLGLFRNPFYPAIGNKFLIEYEKGGFLEGPSHSQGGIPAIIGNKKMVELEGGEFIINKKAVNTLGTGFMEMINGASSPGSASLLNQYGFMKFAWGGSTSFEEFKNKGRSPKLMEGSNNFLSYNNISSFAKNLTGSIGSLASVLDIKQTGFSSNSESPGKRNENRYDSVGSQTPAIHLIEPKSGLPQFDLFAGHIKTNGWFKDIVGDHGVELEARFPYGFRADMYADGGPIPLNVGDIYGGSSGFYDKGNNISINRALAYDKTGKDLNADVLTQKSMKASFENKMEDKSFGWFSAIPGIPEGLTTTLQDALKILDDNIPYIFSTIDDVAHQFVASSLDLLGSFGANFGNYMTDVDPFAGLFGAGEGFREQVNAMDVISVIGGIVSLAAYFEEASGIGLGKGGNPILSGWKTVGDFMEQLSFGMYKQPKGGSILGDIPAWIPLFLGTAPIFPMAKDEVDTIPSLTMDKRGSIWDMLYSIYDASGRAWEDASDDWDIKTGGRFPWELALAATAVYGLYKGGSYMYDVFAGESSKKAPSSYVNPTPSFLNVFNNSSGSSSSRSYVPSTPSYLSGGSNSPRYRYQNTSAFAEGGLAVGPSHDGGMLGLSNEGMPFLFEGGEYIINKDAVNKVGLGALNKINSGKMPKFQTGGMVGVGSISRNNLFGSIPVEDMISGMDGNLGLLSSLLGVFALNALREEGTPSIFENPVEGISNIIAGLLSSSGQIFSFLKGLTVGGFESISKNLSNFAKDPIGAAVGSIERIISGDWGSFTDAVAPGVSEVFRDYYNSRIGNAKRLDPLMRWKLKKSGLSKNAAEGAKYVVGGGENLFARDPFSSTLASGLISLLDGFHPSAFVVGDLITFRDSFINGAGERGYKITGFGPADYMDFGGRSGSKTTFWEFFGRLISHEAKHVDQFKSKYREVNFDTLSDSMGNYMDNYKDIENEADDFASKYVSIFGTGLNAKHPVMGSSFDSNYYFSLRDSVNEFSSSYLDELLGGRGSGTVRSYGSGGMLQSGGLAVGPSHQSGMVGYAADGGQPFLFEGGEYIINKKATEKLGVGFLDSLNFGMMGRGGNVPSFRDGTVSPLSRALGLDTPWFAGDDEYWSGSGYKKKKNTSDYFDIKGNGVGISEVLDSWITGRRNRDRNTIKSHMGGKTNWGGLAAGLLGGLGGMALLAPSLTSDNMPILTQLLLAGGLGYGSYKLYQGLTSGKPWFGKGGSIPSFGNGGAELAKLGMKGFMTYALGQSIFDFIMSDNKFSTPKGSPANQLNPFVWMSLMGLMHQAMMKGIPTKYNSGGAIPSFGRGGAGFSYEDLDFFGMFSGIGNFFNWLFGGSNSIKPTALPYMFKGIGYRGLSNDYRKDDFNFLGNGGTLPSFGRGGAGFSYEDIGNLFSSIFDFMTFGLFRDNSPKSKGLPNWVNGGRGSLDPLHLRGRIFSNKGKSRATAYNPSKHSSSFFDWFGKGGKIQSFRSGGDVALLAGLLGGIGGNFLSDSWRGPGSYFGRSGDAGLLGGLSGLASYIMLSNLFGTKTNNTDQTKALLLAGLLGYGTTPFEYSSSSRWKGYGKWDGVSGSEMGSGGDIPSYGLGGKLETIALLYALLGGYTGYKGSQLYGPWTGSTLGDISLGFFGGLLPFFLGTNIEALRGNGGSISSFRSGGDVALLAGLLGGIGGNFLSDSWRGPGSYFGRSGDAGILGGVSGVLSYIMLSNLLGTKTNNTDQTKALLLSGLLGYASTPFNYSSSSRWRGYGKWDGVSGSEMGGGGSIPSFGMGGTFDLLALMFAGETARRGYYGGSPFSEYFGESTSGRIGDAGLSFLAGLLPFILAANNDQVFAGIDNVRGFLKKGNGGSVPSFGLGGQLETVALLYALLGGYTGYKGSQLYGPWTGSTFGDISLGFLGGLLPFFLGTNIEALRGDGGSVPSFRSGGDVALLAGLLGGIGGNFLSDSWRGVGSYFGRPGDAGILGGITGLASYIMLSSLFGTRTNNSDQTKAFLLSGLLGYASTPSDYSSSSRWKGYGKWDGMGSGGKIPSFEEGTEGGFWSSLGSGLATVGDWMVPDIISTPLGWLFYDLPVAAYDTATETIPNWYSRTFGSKKTKATQQVHDDWYNALAYYASIWNWFGSGGSVPSFGNGGLAALLLAPFIGGYMSDHFRGIFSEPGYPGRKGDSAFLSGVFGLLLSTMMGASKQETMLAAAGSGLLGYLFTGNKYSSDSVWQGTEGKSISSLTYGSGGSLLTAGTGLAIGPSHQSGMLGMTKSGAPFLFEGGEYIINKDVVNSLGIGALNQLNKGNAGIFADGGSITGSDLGVGEQKYSKFILYADQANIESISAMNAENNFVRYGSLGVSDIISTFAKGGALGTVQTGTAIGPDHQSGMLGMTKDGAPFLFEGGEYIVNSEAADKLGLKNMQMINRGILPKDTVVKMGSGGIIPSFGTSNASIMKQAQRNLWERNLILDAISPKKTKGMSSIGRDIWLVTGASSLLGTLLMLSDAEGRKGLEENSAIQLMAAYGLLFGGIEGYNFFSKGSGGTIPAFGKSKGGISDTLAGYGGITAGILSLGLLGKLIYDTDDLLGNKSKGIKSSLGFGSRDQNLLAALLLIGGLGYGGYKGASSGFGNVWDDWETPGMSLNDFKTFGLSSRGSGGSLPSFGSGNALTKTLPFALGLIGAGYYTGFGDFLSGMGDRQNPMTAGRAGKGFGQLIGTILSTSLIVSGTKNKNPLNFILGFAALEGTRRLFADSPRGRSSNPFSFGGTQKYNKSKFGKGGAIPSFNDGETLKFLAQLSGMAGHGINKSIGTGGPWGDLMFGGGLGIFGGLLASVMTGNKDAAGLFGALGLLFGAGTAYSRGEGFGKGGAISSAGKGLSISTGLPAIDMMGGLLLALGGAGALQSDNSLAKFMGLSALMGGGLMFGTGFGNAFLGFRSGGAIPNFEEGGFWSGVGNWFTNFFSEGTGGGEPGGGRKFLNFLTSQPSKDFGLGFLGTLFYGMQTGKGLDRSVKLGLLSGLFSRADSSRYVDFMTPYYEVLLADAVNSFKKSRPERYQAKGSGGSIPSFKGGGFFDWLSDLFTPSPRSKVGLATWFPWLKSSSRVNSALDSPFYAGLYRGDGGTIPSYRQGKSLSFPMPAKLNDSRFWSKVGVGSGLGLFAGLFAGGLGAKMDNTGLLTLMLLGGLGGGLLGKREQDGFDMFGNLLPSQGKIGREVGWIFGNGGRIRAFNKGGLAVGPSHQSGMVGYAAGGEPFLFEGGEYIIRKDSVDALGVSFFDAVNEGAISFGKGGRIPSFQEGTESPLSWLQMPTYGRRDLFGSYKTQTTLDDGSTVDTYITNMDDFTSAGVFGDQAELLKGITNLLNSLLITTMKTEKVMVDGVEQEKETIDKLSTFALETSLGVQLGMSAFSNNIKETVYARNENDQLLNAAGKVVTDPEDAQVLLGAGNLLRVQLDLLGVAATGQFTSAVYNGVYSAMLALQPSGGGGGTPFEDALLQQGLPVILEAAGLSAGAAGFATMGIMYGRATAEDGKADIATAAGLAAAMFTPPGWAAIAALAAAEVMGKPENYFAEVGIDEQMDVQEPITGLYDELFNDKDGIFTYPAESLKKLDFTKPGNAFADAHDRLNQGAAHMNMNSQKLASKLENVFGMDEGDLQFDAIGGARQSLEQFFEDPAGEIKSGWDSLGERLKQLGEAMFKDLGEAITNFFKAPLDFMDNFGKQIQDNIQGSIGDFIGAHFRFPLELVEAVDRVFNGAASKVIEKVQEFLQFPAKFITNLSNNIGSVVDRVLSRFFGEIPGDVRDIIVDMTKGFFNLPVAFVNQLSSGALTKSVTMLPGIILDIVSKIVNIPVEIIKSFSKDVLGVELSDKFSGESVVNTIINLPFNFLNKFMEQISGGKKEDSNGGIIPMPQVLKDAFGWTEDYLIPLKIGGLDLSGAASGDLFPTLSPAYNPMSSFQRGGLAMGPSHANGGIPGMVGGVRPIEFEGGEYIINKKTVDLLGAGFFNYINSIKSRSFASGGSIAGVMSEADKIAQINKEKERDFREIERIEREIEVKEKRNLASSTAPSYKKGSGWGSTKTLPDILLNQELTIGGTLGEVLKKVPVIGFNSVKFTLPTYDASKAFFGTQKKALGGYLFSDGGGVRLGREPMRRKDGTIIRDRNGNIMYHRMMDAPDAGGRGGLTFAPGDIRGEMLADRDKMRIRRYEDAMVADRKVSDSMGSATVKSGKRRLFGFGPDRIDAAIAKSLGLLAYGGPVEKFGIGGSLGKAVSGVSNAAKSTVSSVSQAASGVVSQGASQISGTANIGIPDLLDPETYTNAAKQAAKTAADLGKEIQDKVGIDLTKVDLRDLKPSDFGVIESIVGKEALEFLISITEYDYIEGFEQAWAVVEYLYNSLLPKLEWSLGVDLGNLKNPIGTSGRGIFYGLGGFVSKAAGSIGSVAKKRDIGKKLPSIGKIVPKIAKKIPSIGKIIPKIGNKVPNIDKIIPKIGKKTPNIGSVLPKILKKIPKNDGGKLPNILDVIPNNIGNKIPGIGNFDLPNLGKIGGFTNLPSIDGVLDTFGIKDSLRNTRRDISYDTIGSIFDQESDSVSDFSMRIANNTSITNDLLRTLITITESKDVNIEVVESNEGEKRNLVGIRLDKDREMAYRGARMLA